jgi:hypothetical protein
MGVYIDMEMPKDGFVEILIRDDGTVQQTGQSYRIDGTDYYTPYVGEMPKMFTAVPVPPHGDLIDRDALIKDGWLNLYKEVMRMGGYAIHELPLKNPSIAVIIPAEEGEA